MKFKRDIILISSLFALFGVAALVVGLTSKQDNLVATIYQKERIVASIDLSKETSERSIVFEEISKEVVFLVKHNAIAIGHNDCPGQYCVKQGYSSHSNMPIICAHHAITIKLNSSKNPLDAVVG